MKKYGTLELTELDLAKLLEVSEGNTELRKKLVRLRARYLQETNQEVQNRLSYLKYLYDNDLIKR